GLVVIADVAPAGVRVVSDEVAGGDGAADALREALDPPAHDEEGRAGAVGGEDGEHLLGDGRVGAVVEGERDAVARPGASAVDEAELLGVHGTSSRDAIVPDTKARAEPGLGVRLLVVLTARCKAGVPSARTVRAWSGAG